MPAQEQGCGAGLPGGGIEAARGLQGERACLAQNGGQGARMQGFLHNAQDFGVLRAIHPDDAGEVEAQPCEARRVAIGAGCCPEEKATVLAQNACRYRCSERRHGWRQLALQAVRAKFVKRAKG